jgi:hypothetical protein
MLGGKGDQCVGLTTLPSSYADSIEILGISTSLHRFTFTRNPFSFIKRLARKIEDEDERFPVLHALPIIGENERKLLYRTFLLSPHGAQRVYCIESLHSPGHPLKPAMLRTAIK